MGITFLACCGLFCRIGFIGFDPRAGSRFEAAKEIPMLEFSIFPAAAAAISALTTALFLTFLLFLPLVGVSFQLIAAFPPVVDSFALPPTFPLGFSFSDSALAPVNSFALCFSSESDSASLLTDSLAARLEEDVAAPSFDVDADVLCPSSTTDVFW